MTPVTDIIALAAAELGGAFRSRELSPVEVAKVLLSRIDEVDESLNAFCLLDSDETLRQARAAESRLASGEPLGPLDGVPVAIKDVFLTAGWPTLKGSKIVDQDQQWNDDAPAVARLREAGAVFVGKTTTPEFGWKGLTDSPLVGVTRNPWDTALTPGGSSGGSAAALAAGMAPLALGTDGGGSIRIPGSFTGTTGIKPTFARVPHWPMSPFGTLAHAGPMARTVADTALLLQVLAGDDARDWTALPTNTVDFPASLDGGVAGLRVAFSLTLGYVDVDPEVAAAVAKAAEVFESLGARVVAHDPGFSDPLHTWEVLWYAGAAAVVADLDEQQRALLDPGLDEITAEGASLTALDYMRAVQERIGIAVTLSAMLSDDFDLLLTPTMPIPPFTAGAEVPRDWPHRRWQTWAPFSLPFNLSQQPAATLPCGLNAEGLPIGLQIVAAKHRDDLVLRAARAYETASADAEHDFTRPLDSVRSSD
ncbi:MAG: amidase [Gaiellales bacterium]